MVNSAKLRDQLRPQGLVSQACASCQFYELCGGFFSGRLFGTCFDELCCHFTGKDKANCNAVCPYKRDFPEWVADTRGLRFDDLPLIEQPDLVLPTYIPVIDHASNRSKPLEWPLVALNAYSVMSLRRNTKQYEAIAVSPQALRERLLLATNTEIVLRGVGNDSQLEKYWHHRITANAPAQLARLNVHSAIGPNFSHFLDVPRTDHLYNKRRQLICLVELAEAGIPVVPHLNSVSPGDWEYWRRYLQRNDAVRVVAIEFQTGNKNCNQGRRALNYLAATQKRLSRPLHLVLVGGGRFIEYAAARFADISLLDSTPFHRTMRRARFERSEWLRGGWREGYSLCGQRLDELLLDNITGYARWIEDRIALARRTTNT